MTAETPDTERPVVGVIQEQGQVQSLDVEGSQDQSWHCFLLGEPGLPFPVPDGIRMFADHPSKRGAGQVEGPSEVFELIAGHGLFYQFRRCSDNSNELLLVSLVRIPSPPPLAPAKAFSRSGCGRIFPLFSRVMQEGLSTGLGARRPEGGLSGPILSGPHD